MDNIDGLVQDVIDSTNENTKSIKETLEQEVSGVGGILTKEMQSIWDGTGKNVVGDGINTVSATLTDIKNLVAKMVGESNTVANNNVKDAQTSITPSTTVTPTVNKPSTTSNSSSNAKTITVGGLINAGSAKIYDYAGSNSGQRQYYRANPIYTVLSEKNGYLKVRHQSLSSGTTGWFKKSDVKAYKTGGLVDETGLAWLDGTKGRPEMVLNPHDTENYMKLTETLRSVANTNMFDAIGNYAKLPNFVPNGNMQNREGDITFDIKMYGVNDPQEMAQQVKKIYQDNIGNVRKTIRADVYGGMLNKNGLTRYKY